MKILLPGKNVQVDFELLRALAPHGEVHAVDVAECNLTDESAVWALVQRNRPDVIVNPAAYTAVDKAESELEFARAPAVLAQEGVKLGVLVAHYSTDYVFGGMRQRACIKDDLTNPQSVFVNTKSDGELALKNASAEHLILGGEPTGVTMRVLSLSRQSRRLPLWDTLHLPRVRLNRRWTPTSFSKPST